MPFSPGSFLGPYEIIGIVGSGGMGEVYRARDTTLQRDVALKMLHPALANDPERRARFEREAQILASLNHPNIAAIYGFESGAIVMEYVEGPTIAERIRKSAIGVEETAVIARQIISAFDAAHEKGIVHRDLKPANVKINPQGVVKVLDFGLARAVEPMRGEDAPTMTLGPTVVGAIMGTPGYMSPEQARGQTVDKRGDIFAFGVLLYEMLSGKRAFEGESVADTLASVLKTEPDLGKLPAGAPRALIAHCMEKDPKRRLRDISDALLLLEPGATPAARAGRSNKWLTPALAAVGVLAGLGISRMLVAPAPPPALVRFNIALPEGMTTPTVRGGHSIAISPDGQLAVFTAGSQGETRLYLQPLDEADAKPLANTEEPMAPFFSPDGQYLAFGAKGMLKRLNIKTGAVDNLAEVGPFLRSGGWNEDGVIIYGTQISTLFRVSSSGGKPEPLTALDKDRKESAHYWPQFLPDGRRFIFHARSPDEEKSGIFAAELPSVPGALAGNRKWIVATEAAAHFVPDDGGGRLLYIRDGNLIAQRMDLSRLELTGEPVVVARDVAVSRINGLAEFAVSGNGRLMYIQGGGREAARLGWYDRSGKLLGEVGDPFAEGLAQASLSPDERLLAALYRSQQQGSRRFELAIFDLRAGTRAGIPMEGIALGSPQWSADGQWVAISYLDGSILRIRKDGTEKQLLARSPGLRVSAWSPDGKHLLASQNPGNPISDVMSISLAAEPKIEPLVNSPAAEHSPKFSPNGRYFAYASNESGDFRAYVEPFPRRGVKWQISAGGPSSPMAWRQDGREIILGGSGAIQSVSVELRPDGPRFGAPEVLFPGVGVYGVTRDGQKFLRSLTETERGASKISVVLNWATLLARK